MNWLFGLIIVGLVVGSQSVEQPDNLKECNITIDQEWISEVLHLFSHILYPGEEESLLSKRLTVDDVHNDVVTELVSMKLNYTNNVVYGSSLVIDDQSFNANNLSLYFNAFCDWIEFVGDYAADGRLSVIPINGAGSSHLTMLDVNTKNTLQLESYDKDGKEFFRVTEWEMTLEPKKVHFNYTGLATPSQSLRSPIDTIINANWKVFFEDTTKEPLEKLFASLFTEIANEAFSLVSIN